jgi:hypothetical protein
MPTLNVGLSGKQEVLSIDQIFVFLQKRPYFADKPSERRRASQCGPWAADRRGSGQIPATGSAGVRGEGGGRLKAHLGVDFRARRG